MAQIIDSQSQFTNVFVKENVRSNLFLHLVVTPNPDLNVAGLSKTEDLSFLYVFNLDTHKDYVINFNHYDGLFKLSIKEVENAINTRFVDGNLFVSDKKSFTHLLNLNNLIDINVLLFLGYIDSAISSEISIRSIEELYYQSLPQRFSNHHKIKNLNSVIPLAVHTRILNEQARMISNLNLSVIINSKENKAFKAINNTMIQNFKQLESAGLKIDKELFIKHFDKKHVTFKKQNPNFVYTKYNLFTSTGRPSNCFANINYAALKKDDDSRSAFVSRYHPNGFLFLADYTAYHPRLISKLINYGKELPENVYEYLGKAMFNKTELTPEELRTAKTSTFSALYGYIPDSYLHVEFFNKTKQYIDLQWNKFMQDGYVETPVYQRHITANKNIQDPNPNKVFNYILQAYETERNNEILTELFSFLEPFKTKPILYIYDSLLFDVPSDEETIVLPEIVNIMQQDNCYTKLYRGTNYNNLELFKLK
jgi:hypothetical protein